MHSVVSDLFSMQDLNYKAFQEKLIPTVNRDQVIGVRTPDVRSYAKKLSHTKQAYAYLSDLPHRYYEENNLHCMLLNTISDYETCICAINDFLPYIDNWATCDILRPKCFRENKQLLRTEIDRWLHSEHIYTVRFAIEMLLVHYLDKEFQPEDLRSVSSVYSEEYYIRMIIAWYFASALVTQYGHTIIYLETNQLPIWTHNKAIQKAIESRRITSSQKTYLRTLKRKSE